MKKLASSTSFWSFFLVAFLGILGGVLTGVVDAKIEDQGTPFSFGGPTGEKEFMGMEEGTLHANGGNDDFFAEGIGGAKPEDGALAGASSPSAHIVSTRNGIKNYKVQKGDTLSGVAANFGVSLDTLKWANTGIRSLISTG